MMTCSLTSAVPSGKSRMFMATKCSGPSPGAPGVTVSVYSVGYF